MKDCFVIVLLIFVLSLNSLAAGENDYETSGMIVRDITCYDIFKNAYILDVPHPSNCSMFVKCSEDTPGYPSPNIFHCPEKLLFDFVSSCNCEWPLKAKCYDVNNIQHVADTFRCACPLTRNSDGVLVPDPYDDRCANGVDRKKRNEEKLRNPPKSILFQ